MTAAALRIVAGLAFFALSPLIGLVLVLWLIGDWFLEDLGDWWRAHR